MEKQGRKASEKHPKIIQKSSKMAPKIDPGGLRRPLRSQVGAQRLQNSLSEAAGSSKNQF